MTPQQMVGLAVRLFAIWLFFFAIESFLGLKLMQEQNPGDNPVLTYLVPILQFATAAALWLFPMFVAHTLLPRTHDNNVLSLPARQLVAACSAILGLYLLTMCLPPLLTYAVALLQLAKNDMRAILFEGDRGVQFTLYVFQFLIAAFLVFKPWFVAKKIFPSEPVAQE